LGEQREQGKFVWVLYFVLLLRLNMIYLVCIWNGFVDKEHKENLFLSIIRLHYHYFLWNF